MVFQHFNLFNNYSVLGNLMLAPVDLKRATKEEARETALKMLKKVGLEDKADAISLPAFGRSETACRHCKSALYESRYNAF